MYLVQKVMHQDLEKSLVQVYLFKFMYVSVLCVHMHVSVLCVHMYVSVMWVHMYIS